MDNKLQDALTAAAQRLAASYAKHGREHGGPKTWCNEHLLDAVLDDSDFVEALQDALETAFLKAVG
jgi:hypothetical protein